MTNNRKCADPLCNHYVRRGYIYCTCCLYGTCRDIQDETVIIGNTEVFLEIQRNKGEIDEIDRDSN